MVAPWPPLLSMVGAAFNGRTVEWWWEGCCCRCKRELRQASTRREHPRSPNLFSPRRRRCLQWRWARALETTSVTSGSVRSHGRFSKRNNETVDRRARLTASYTDAPLAKTLLSLRLLSPPLLRGARDRESLLLPAGPPASTPVTALASLACGNLRCRRGPRGKVHTRAKIAF